MLVVQMFRLMDKILKADNLDLKFTLYSVLATSISEGFVQFVKATPLRNVVAQYKSIQVWHYFTTFSLQLLVPVHNLTKSVDCVTVEEAL